jgi:hypothetical protein
MRLIAVASLAALVTISALSGAQAGYTIDGDVLYNWCTSTAETLRIGCGTYIAGVTDGGYASSAIGSPESLTRGHGRDRAGIMVFLFGQYQNRTGRRRR